MAENAAFTERYERAYAPFEDGPENALVFVPTPYGDWLAHPFQYLRNGPELGGERVYALDRGGRNLALLDSYPNRTPYRYTYRGEWSGEPGDDITPSLTRLDRRTALRHRITTTVGVPTGMDSASVRLEVGDRAIQYVLTRPPGETLDVAWTLGPDGVRARGEELKRIGGPAALPVERGEVALAVTFLGDGGATVTYRQELAVESQNRHTSVLWPPESEICRLTTDCGHEGTYVPGADDYPPGASMNTTVESENATESRLSGNPSQRARSSRHTSTTERAMAAPPASGSSVVSPSRSPYSMGISRTA